MADVSITPSSVTLVSGRPNVTWRAGEVIDAGEIIYIDDHTTRTSTVKLAFRSDNVNAKTGRAAGIALAGALAVGQIIPVVTFNTGLEVEIGVTLATEPYVLSTNPGKFHPASDLTGTSHHGEVFKQIGLGQGNTKLKLETTPYRVGYS